MLRIVLFTLLWVVLLNACAPAAPSQPTVATQTKPAATVYKSPT